jgi:hypothetical protein
MFFPHLKQNFQTCFSSFGQLFFTCNNGGEYRLAYPQLAARQKRPKPESCLLSYSEWKSKDNSLEIITQLNVPDPAKSKHVVIEEPKYDFQEKGQEKRCLICVNYSV